MQSEIMLEFQSAAAAIERWRHAERPGAAELALDAAAALERAAAGLRQSAPAEARSIAGSDFAAAMRRVEAECYDSL